MFYESRIKIMRLDYPFDQLAGNDCANYKVPKRFSINNVDLVLFASAMNEPDQGYVAWASPCSLDPRTNRPVAG
jgi:hypothetical protein